MLIHPFYFHSGNIYNRMYKDGRRWSNTNVSQEAAWFTKEGKVLTAFQDKDSRAEFEKLVKEAKEDGRLPKELLLEVTASDTESEGDVEIDIKEGTEADGFY